MIDTVFSVMMTIPALVGLIFMISFIIMAIVSTLYAILSANENGIKFLCEIFDPDSCAYTANTITASLMLMAYFGYICDVISYSTLNLFVGAASITSVWYFVYIFDIWLDLYHEHQLRKDKGALK